VKRFIERLFAFGREETRGEILRFQLLQLFLLGWGVYFAWSWGLFMRQIPAVVVPQGIARELDLSWLVGGDLGLVNAALITLCAAGVLLGRGARACSVLLVLLLHVQYVARHCLGKVAHGSQYVGMGLLLLALAIWLMPTASARRRFTLGGTLLFMGAGYVCAAISKLAARGLRWPDGSHLWLWIGEKGIDQLSDLGHTELNALQRLCLQHWWLATTFLALGLLTEACGFLLWFSRTRTPITLALIGLHLGVYWSMDILFDTYIYQLLIVGLPLPALFDRLLAQSTPRARSVLD
jgi:energy-coupling factor transporter transmembrane protein EcfT